LILFQNWWWFSNDKKVNPQLLEWNANFDAIGQFGELIRAVHKHRHQWKLGPQYEISMSWQPLSAWIPTAWGGLLPILGCCTLKDWNTLENHEKYLKTRQAMHLVELWINGREFDFSTVVQPSPSVIADTSLLSPWELKIP
jgi:hypothetical protein